MAVAVENAEKDTILQPVLPKPDKPVEIVDTSGQEAAKAIREGTAAIEEATTIPPSVPGSGTAGELLKAPGKALGRAGILDVPVDSRTGADVQYAPGETLGKGMTESLETQRGDIDFNTFARLIETGNAPSVAGVSNETLAQMLKTARDPNNMQSQRAQKQLEGLLANYNITKPKTSLTAFGTGQFVPTIEAMEQAAEGDTAQIDAQRTQHGYESAVMRSIRGRLNVEGMDPRDIGVIEEELLGGITTNELGSLLITKFDEQMFSGAAFFAGDMILDIVPMAIATAVETGLYNIGNTFLPDTVRDKDLDEVWNEWRPIGEAMRESYRQLILDPMGVQLLHENMNDIIVERVERRFADDPERAREILYPVLLNPDTLTPLTDSTGAPLRSKNPREFVSQDQAALIATESYNTLADSKQWFAATIDTVTIVAPLLRGRVKKSKKELEKVNARIDELTKGDEELAGILASMSTGEKIAYLQADNKLGKFNFKLVSEALDFDAADAGSRRIIDEIAKVEKDKADLLKKHNLKGGSSILPAALKADIQDLDRRQALLQNQLFLSKLQMHGRPVLRSTITTALPLSTVQYLSGEYLTGFLGGGDRIAAEGMGALAYFVAGPNSIIGLGGLGRLGAYANYKFAGDIVGASAARIESFLNIGADFILDNPNLFTGTLTDTDLRTYIKRLESERGSRLSYKEYRSLQYVKKLASVLDDESRGMVLNSIETYKKLQKRIVGAMPVEKQGQALKVFQESFATMSNLGWMRSAQALALSKVSVVSLSSEKSVKEAAAAAEMMNKNITQANFGIQNLKRMLKENIFDPDDAEFIENYIDTMQKAVDLAGADADRSAAILGDRIEEIVTLGVSDPSIPINGQVIDRLIDVGFDVQQGIKESLDRGSYYNRARANVNEALVARADALRQSRGTRDDLLERARTAEVTLLNHLDSAQDQARVGFISLDKEFAQEGKTVDVADMITEMFSFMGDAEFGKPVSSAQIRDFFSEESEVFKGKFGSRVREVFENMARRTMDRFTEEDLQNLLSHHRTKFDENGNVREHFISENASLMDVIGFKLSRGEFKAFKATPQEVMLVVSAFHDYAIANKNPQLARLYHGYADKAAEIVAKQHPEFANKWQAAADTYKTLWFDRFYRHDGPVNKVRRAQISGQFGTKAQREQAFDEEVSLFGELFSYGYKANADPITFLNPLIKRFQAALKPGASDVQRGELQSMMHQLIAEIGDRDVDGNIFFDAGDEDSMKRLFAFKRSMEELFYDVWAADVVKKLDDTTPFRVGAVSEGARTVQNEIKRMQETGGYYLEFMDMDNVAFVEESATVMIKNPKGRDYEVKIFDLEGIVSEERSIERLITTNEKYRDEAVGHLQNFAKKVDSQVESVKKRDKAADAGMRQLLRGSKVKSGSDFATTYLINGTTKGIAALKEKARVALSGNNPDKTTVDIDGVEFEIDEVIDLGIKKLLVDALQEVGGLQAQPGNVVYSFFGNESVGLTYTKPGELLKLLDNEKAYNNIAEILDEDHAQYIKDIAQYMNMKNTSLDFDPRLEGIVKPFGVNSLISRAFNIRRGMVSPQYVAAEIAVAVASQAGIDMMKLAAVDENAAALMHRFIEFPKDMTKKELDTFSAQITTFLVSEAAYLGLNFEELVINMGENFVEAGVVAATTVSEGIDLFDFGGDEQEPQQGN